MTRSTHHTDLKDGAVEDSTHSLCILPPLGVRGAGLWCSSSRQGAERCCEFRHKGCHAVLHISFWGGKVVTLVPGQCSTQAAHLVIYTHVQQRRIDPMLWNCLNILFYGNFTV